MKKYRRSFWAASCVNSMIIPWIVAFVFSYLSVKDRIDISRVLSFYGLIFGGIPTLVILTYFFVSEFYVILSDDALILKNAICPFWKKKVLMLKRKILHIYYEKISSFFLGSLQCKFNDNTMGSRVDILLFFDG